MRRTLISLGIAALAAGATAAPAAAELASPLSALSCAPGTSAGQAFASASRTGRGDREAAARSLVGDSEIPAGREPGTSASFAATIPVYFHVLAKGTRARDGWVSDRQIHEQMAVLNRAFAAGYGGAPTGFRFELRAITRTVNARWHEMATLEDELEAKRALRQGDATALNVYSTNIYLGFAYYPKIVAGGYGGFQDLDGIVIHFGSMPGGHIKNYNLGHTATHEAGHWLGLPHTFDQGCQGHGDHVDDTPAMSVPTSGCPAGKDTCPEPGLDPIHNYMDYSFDSCYSEFSAGQGARMQQQYLHWRVKHGYSPGT